MKKLLALLLALVMVVSLASCGGHDDNTPSGDNNSGTPQSVYTELYENWRRLVGYWNAAEGRFAMLDMENSNAVFSYGMWETEFASGYGKVTEIISSEEDLTATVYWEKDDPTELIVIIDYSGLERDGKIRIKIGQEDWMQYMYAGATSDEALQTHVYNRLGN